LEEWDAFETEPAADEKYRAYTSRGVVVEWKRDTILDYSTWEPWPMGAGCGPDIRSATPRDGIRFSVQQIPFEVYRDVNGEYAARRVCTMTKDDVRRRKQ
jgi:hypothetical protein